MRAVLVTRPAGEDDPLVLELGARGYRVIAIPTVLTRPVAVDWPDLEGFDWIVVTSATGVDALPQLPAGPRWGAVGKATASALRARGVHADFLPAEANGASLGEGMPDVEGKRVLLVRASLADPDLPAALRRRGAEVFEVVAYETVEGPVESADAIRRAIAEPELAAVVFASGSAVRGFVKLGGQVRLPAVTIGPRTTAEARRAGFKVAAEAAEPGARQLAEAVEQAIPIEVQRNA